MYTKRSCVVFVVPFALTLSPFPSRFPSLLELDASGGPCEPRRQVKRSHCCHSFQQTIDNSQSFSRKIGAAAVASSAISSCNRWPLAPFLPRLLVHCTPLLSTMVELTWQEKSAAKRTAQAALIPDSLQIKKPPGEEVLNVADFPFDSILSPRDIEITTVEDVTTLLARVASGHWSATEVTRAFCNRALVAHQLVSCRLVSACRFLVDSALLLLASYRSIVSPRYSSIKPWSAPLSSIPTSPNTARQSGLCSKPLVQVKLNIHPTAFVSPSLRVATDLSLRFAVASPSR